MTKETTRGGLVSRALSCGCAVALAASLAPAAGVAWAAQADVPALVDPTDITVNVGTSDADGAYHVFASKTVNIAASSVAKTSNAVLFNSGTADAPSWGVVATSQYVTLSTILSAAGLGEYWDADASLQYASSGATGTNASSFANSTYAKYNSMYFFGATEAATNPSKLENAPSGTKVEPGLALWTDSAAVGGDVYTAASSSSSSSNASGTASLMSKGFANNTTTNVSKVVTYMNGLSVTDYKSGVSCDLDEVTVGSTASDAITTINILVGESTNASRIYGTDWADTMVASVKATFGATKKSSIVLTTAEAFQDALAASGLAGALGCPIIMTDGDELTPQAGDLLKTYLDTSAAANIYVIGGEVAIKPAVLNAIKELPAFYGKTVNMTRIAGPEAWDTSLEVYKAAKGDAKYRIAANTKAGKDDIVVACSGGFADAMSIAPYAYASGTPIILTDNTNMLSASELTALTETAATKLAATAVVNIIGGPAVVSASVEGQLTGVENVYRTYGQTEYNTSNLVATYLTKENKRFQATITANFAGADTACFACGENYLDALASAAYCGTSSVNAGGSGKTAVLLLISNGDQTTADEFLKMNAYVNDTTNNTYKYATIFGGPGVLNNGVQVDINNVLTKKAK